MLQAAVAAATYANERYSASGETYRVQEAAKEYASQLEKLCGKNGVGGDIDFPVKKRGKAQGGDWTYLISVARRPLKPKALYQQAKKAAAWSMNTFVPLMKKLCVSEHDLPSGWNPEQYEHAMLYNLYKAYEKKAAAKAKAREAKKAAAAAAAAGAAEGEGEDAVEGEEAEEAEGEEAVDGDGVDGGDGDDVGGDEYADTILTLVIRDPITIFLALFILFILFILCLSTIIRGTCSCSVSSLQVGEIVGEVRAHARLGSRAQPAQQLVLGAVVKVGDERLAQQGVAGLTLPRGAARVVRRTHHTPRARHLEVSTREILTCAHPIGWAAAHGIELVVRE